MFHVSLSTPVSWVELVSSLFFHVVDPLEDFRGSRLDLGDSSAEGEHAAVVDDVVNVVHIHYY